jgi:hypothetical protein
MKSPYSDPTLSLRARGLYALFVEMGRVPSSDELLTAVPEGRDAIRNAMTELKEGNYIKAIRSQVNGQWRTTLKFVDETIGGLGNAFSGVGVPVVGESGVLSNYNTSDIATSYTVLEVLRTSNTSGAPKSKEGSEMTWPGMEEEQEPQSRSQVRRIAIQSGDDDIAGAVGKFEDKKAMRNAKYKKTSFEAVPATMRRFERVESEWTTQDLVAEFYDLVREKCPGIPGQMNGHNMTTWINKLVGEGTARTAILKGIRLFFADPRLLHDAGVGQPIWRRFIAYYPTIHGLTVRVDESKYVDADFDSHQERMLKLLEGSDDVRS